MTTRTTLKRFEFWSRFHRCAMGFVRWMLKQEKNGPAVTTPHRQSKRRNSHRLSLKPHSCRTLPYIVRKQASDGCPQNTCSVEPFQATLAPSTPQATFGIGFVDDSFKIFPMTDFEMLTSLRGPYFPEARTHLICAAIAL